jgi:hypothetical protein
LCIFRMVRQSLLRRWAQCIKWTIVVQTLARELLKCSERNLMRCHFSTKILHFEFQVTEPVPLRWETGDWVHELSQVLHQRRTAGTIWISTSGSHLTSQML